MYANEEKDKGLKEGCGGAACGTSEEKKAGALEALRSVGFGMLYAICGYWMGGVTLPFGAAPFGIALLCAADRRVLYLYAGLCLSAFFGSSRILMITVYTAILLLRLLTRLLLDTPWRQGEGQAAGELTVRQVWPVLFCEQTALRMSSAAIAAFGAGLYRLILGGFLFYDLYGTILATLISPVAVLLFCGYWGQESRESGRYLSGVLSIAFVLIRGTVDARLYGISPGMLLAMLLTLYFTRRRGLVHGVIAGAVCGLAVSVSLSPSFAFGAIVAGVLFPVSPFFAATGALTAGVAWGVYVSGIGVLNGLLASLLAACLFFVVWDKLHRTAPDTAEESGTEEEKGSEKRICRPMEPLERDGVLLMERQSRMDAIRESFSSLSEMLLELGYRMQTPEAADLRQICDNAFDGSCVSCSERSGCWGESYRETSGEVGRLCAALHKNGRVDRADAGQALLARCGRLPDILEEINHNTALRRREICEGDRTEIFAMDYRAFSDLLERSMTDEARIVSDPESSERLCRGLSEESLDLMGACVLSGPRRRVAVWGRDPQALLQAEERIRAEVERCCSFSVEKGALCAGESAVMLFLEKERYSVSFARQSLSAEGEETYCGDTVGALHGQRGCFYAFISDGMGAGREAAVTSGICGSFLQKMLGTGNSCEMALTMLNGFLRNRGSGSLHECSATVDLLELDLLGGRAHLYKNGASPTYVLRDGRLLKLRSHTAPIGIIRELDTGRIEFDVSEGDLIVMVSDGVTQGKEECPWLFDLICNRGVGETADEIAERIVQYAKAEGSPDDVSVLAIRIGKQ